MVSRFLSPSDLSRWTAPSEAVSILAGVAAKRTDERFVAEVPLLLAERNLSIRALAKRAGVTDAHLSRVLRGVAYKTPSGDLARRVARALGLAEDHFPEYRQAFVIERIKRDARLREDLYRKLRRRS